MVKSASPRDRLRTEPHVYAGPEHEKELDAAWADAQDENDCGEEGTPDDVEVEGEGLSFWTDLPAHCRDVIAPCLSSGYVMRQLVKPASSVPIFSHNRAWSFRQWLNMWCRHLLSSAGGPRAVVLHACQVRGAQPQSHRIPGINPDGTWSSARLSLATLGLADGPPS